MLIMNNNVGNGRDRSVPDRSLPDVDEDRQCYRNPAQKIKPTPGTKDVYIGKGGV